MVIKEGEEMGKLVRYALAVVVLFNCLIEPSLFPFRVIGAQALKVSISIPELVKLNDGFWLNCSHSSQPDSSSINRDKKQEDIYAIKWYKDDEEFYRYLPNALPKVSIYETNGIQLDQSKSNGGNVFLTKADVNTEGSYRCEVLSEAPLFETVRKSKHLRVYALPIRGPRIEILDSNGRPKSPKAQEISYAIGDKIELRCNSAPSKPAARLRWYVNDVEIPLTAASQNGSAGQALKLLPYEVKATPVEYKQHFKAIYSSHSSLSLKLQQNDLINNKISFKCLAHMRQEVPVRSKQLIVLAQSGAGPASPLSQALLGVRERRDALGLMKLLEAEPNLSPRQRHSLSWLNRPPASARADDEPAEGLSGQEPQPNGSELMVYIYEDADSSLGASIIDSFESLSSYLLQQAARNGSAEQEDFQNSLSNNSKQAYEFNKADNLDYVQILRDRQSRQRSFPQPAAHQSRHFATSAGRPAGLNSLVKSPLYLEENDGLRPVISWPPLESGKLILLQPNNFIVALATAPPSAGSEPQSWTRARQAHSQRKFMVLPSNQRNGKSLEPIRLVELAPTGSRNQADLNRLILFERLLQNLNCTTPEGNQDTKLSWLLNDMPLDSQKDVRLFGGPASGQRQSSLAINLAKLAPGLQPPQQTSEGQPQSKLTPLQTILKQYFSPSSKGGSQTSDSGQRTQSARFQAAGIQSEPASPNQMRFACQALQSLLLYSSSEMVTFDFNPPPRSGSQLDSNSIDGLPGSLSNVILAASQSSSGSRATSNSGSHPLILLSVSLTLLLHLVQKKAQVTLVV